MDRPDPPQDRNWLAGGRWQVVAAYAAGAFAVLEAVDLFSDRFELPGWMFTAAVLLLLFGLPVGVLFSRLLTGAGRARTAGTAEGREAPVGRGRSAPPPGLSWRGAGAAFVVVFALWGVVAAGWMASTSGDRRALELRARALVELPRLAEAGEYEAAHALAAEVERVLPDDSVIQALRPRFSRFRAIESEPAGAAVYRRPYDSGDWTPLGTTPLEAWIPLGAARLRFEKEGWRTGEVTHFDIYGITPVPAVELDRVDSDVPEDMVRVPGGQASVGSPGLEHLPAVGLASYHLDRHEVTNREFARFVDAGGYDDPSYWEAPFHDGDRTLSFPEAMARFTDLTGRPGPATWEGGAYPSGTADHPVGGLSWYEAAAYARFTGEELPTVYHWFHAASTWLSPYIVAHSNYGGDGAAPVGRHDGIARFGAYDMGGNVREWVWNEGGNGRYILGGGWNDESYTFVDPVSQPAFDRSPTNGVRLARFTAATGLEEARAAIPFPSREYATETPAGDEAFAIYRRMYDYDRRPLNAAVELADTTDHWIRERVTFDAAYGGERMLAHVFLPRNAEPPYQTVFYYPGSIGFHGGSSEPPPDVGVIDFIVRSGRAVIRPVLKSTYERPGARGHDQPDPSVEYRDYVIMWAKDMRRSIDYAEEHPALDADRLAYYGVSWGGRMGGLMVPIEPRFDAAVLYVAGLKFQRSLPEADPFNFLPRFTAPVLMLNGRHDNFFPLATSQKPMFEALAAPPEHKRHVVYEGGHYVPRAQLVSETLDWLDRYLGAVR